MLGAPLLTIATRHWPRKQLLMALMLIFIAGNAAAALAPGYGWLMGARVLTSRTAPSLASAPWWPRACAGRKRASAIALMFSGLTLATLLGVPAGAWVGQLGLARLVLGGGAGRRGGAGDSGRLRAAR